MCVCVVLIPFDTPGGGGGSCWSWTPGAAFSAMSPAGLQGGREGALLVRALITTTAARLN